MFIYNASRHVHWPHCTHFKYRAMHRSQIELMGSTARSPNQVLTHAARAAKFQAPSSSGGRARRARRALVRVNCARQTKRLNVYLSILMRSVSPAPSIHAYPK